MDMVKHTRIMLPRQRGCTDHARTRTRRFSALRHGHVQHGERLGAVPSRRVNAQSSRWRIENRTTSQRRYLSADKRICQIRVKPS